MAFASAVGVGVASLRSMTQADHYLVQRRDDWPGNCISSLIALPLRKLQLPILGTHLT